MMSLPASCSPAAHLGSQHWNVLIVHPRCDLLARWRLEAGELLNRNRSFWDFRLVADKGAASAGYLPPP